MSRPIVVPDRDEIAHRPPVIQIPPRVSVGGAGDPLRIILAPVGVEHSADLWAVVQDERERLERWLPWVPLVTHLKELEYFLRECPAEWALGESFRWVMIGDRVPGREGIPTALGIIGFEQVRPPHRSAHLGYWLRAAMEGRGIVRAAASWLLRHGFEDIGLHRVEIAAAVDNRRSRATIVALGGRFEGIRREAEWLGDRVVDHAVYAILATDPPAGGRVGTGG